MLKGTSSDRRKRYTPVKDLDLIKIQPLALAIEEVIMAEGFLLREITN